VIPHHHSSILFYSLLAEARGEVKNDKYGDWGTISSFTRDRGEVVWWDGRSGGHNDIGWAEGSVDLVRSIAKL
jgi:abhydrolase domain-containing protein 12